MDRGVEGHGSGVGLSGKISCLGREPVAEKVVSKLEYEGVRIAGLVLAGSCKQRAILLGVYGHAGASTDNHKAQRQKELWSQLGLLIEANQKLGHHMVVLGDFNVLPSVAFTTSRKALASSVEEFLMCHSGRRSSG